jgi:hypothetical protein
VQHLLIGGIGRRGRTGVLADQSILLVGPFRLGYFSRHHLFNFRNGAEDYRHPVFRDLFQTHRRGVGIGLFHPVPSTTKGFLLFCIIGNVIGALLESIQKCAKTNFVLVVCSYDSVHLSI